MRDISIKEIAADAMIPIGLTAGLLVLASLAATLLWFPWDTDPAEDVAIGSIKTVIQAQQAPRQQSEAAEKIVREALAETVRRIDVASDITRWVTKLNLQDRKILDIGSGTGRFQDLVSNYAGLDIDPRLSSRYHKPFIAASATAMPFADNSFDAAWSIWVLEHIPNPEKALEEMRRVIRPGGYLLLRPAYDVSRYAPKGYLVRPYSDFPWTERPMKAWAMLTDTEGFRSLERPQALFLRSLASSFGPTRLHFSRITPNYTDFWMADAGATTSVSYPEVTMWFTSRGDHCLNCASRLGYILSQNQGSGDGEPMMVMQINK